MRNKYGNIELELPEITLDNNFNSDSQQEITSLLNEEQKEIIRTLGGSKLVLLKFKKLTDANEDALQNVKFVPMYHNENSLCASIYDSNIGNVGLKLAYRKLTDTYIIYS